MVTELGLVAGNFREISLLQKYASSKLNKATAGCDQVIRIWDVRADQCIQTFRGHTGIILHGITFQM